MRSRTLRNFAKIADAIEVPDLIEVQLKGYGRFLQDGVAPENRADIGLEALFREVFPIISYDKTIELEYLGYELEKPRYTIEQCKELRLSYAYPLKVRCRLKRKDTPDIPEQAIYLGEIPVMIGGGEFIINGAERVIVNQLHRSPGVDFVIDNKDGDRLLHGARIIPERGSWIEMSVTRKDVMVIRIDQSSKIPATTFLRAMGEPYGKTEDILRLFYKTQNVKTKKLEPTMWSVGQIVDTETGEILVEAGAQIGDAITAIQASSLDSVEVVANATDPLILNTISEDGCESHDEALTKIYSRLRPGNPANLEKAKQLFDEKFFDTNRYRLGGVGRFRLNRKFGLNVDLGEMRLCAEDFLQTMKYILDLRNGIGEIDDIDHLGNRRLRTIDELAASEVRKGLLKLRRTVQERMSMKSPEEIGRIADLVNSKSVSSSIEFFFGRGELSQVVDQTNALSQLTHERRLSALGPGGLNRKRAGFEVRDVHISHYGRVCPIETPEGTNIGLIVSLGIFAKVDEYGFLVSPYRKVKSKKVTEEIQYLRADEEMKAVFAPPSMVEPIESKISEWMSENMECIALPTLPLESSSDFDYLKKHLEQKTKKDGFLGFVEDRLIVEYPDSRNPKKNAPFFNREYPKNDKDTILKIWEDVSPSLKKWIKSAIETVSTTKSWVSGKPDEGDYPGLYVFRKKADSKDLSDKKNVVYIGISSKSIKGRLSQHWGGNVEGSGLRKHIAEEYFPTRLREGFVLARKDGDLTQVDSSEVGFVDVSPRQTVGVSAALIPFLEHDDANRALMGSNMQRQSVPLLQTEPPLVGTGMEEEVAKYSSMVVRARQSGTVTAVDAAHIVIDQTDEYPLKKYIGLNERTCLNQKPIVTLGQKVKKGQIIADGGGTSDGVLALGRNVLAAFVPFDGYNFEDAILISEKLVEHDTFTSIHIDEFSIDVRETKLGREEFTRDIPNVSEKALRNLDEYGVVREGTRVAPGDILVGKVSPKSKTELTPEEKLLHAIFGRAGEDVKNDSLEVPSGYEGVVIKTRHFKRRAAETDDQRKALKEQMKRSEAELTARECDMFKRMMDAIHSELQIEVVDPTSRQKVGASDDNDVIYEQIENFDIAWIKPAAKRGDAQKIIDQYWPKLAELKEEKKRELERMKHGDELPSGVLEMVKLYIATKRTLSIGDKIAGRHGNKGVIAKILPVEDMPFLEDGTPVDICLNPLGVPSRMNVGQILETLLGWSAQVLGFRAVTPVFAGAEEADIMVSIDEANAHVSRRIKEIEDAKAVPPVDEIFAQMPKALKMPLYDGRTGERFDQEVTVGYMYILKLHHLVDDKIHARSTGPYSLITQQPLGGKARTGGQRFGEMEVWALEAYGAAYTLQELLTVKSDDIEGRTKIYESMVKGTNTLEAGTPISFDVLCNEIRGLGLNIQLEKKRIGTTPL